MILTTVIVTLALLVTGEVYAADTCFDCSPADCIPVALTALCHNTWVRETCPQSCGLCGKSDSSSTKPNCQVNRRVCSALKRHDCVYTLIQKTCPDLCGRPVPTITTTNVPKTTVGSHHKERRICHVCESPFCDMDFEVIEICAEWKPYCMNYIKIDLLGTKTIRKSCVSEVECDYEWLNKTSNLNECRYFDNNKIYKRPLKCQFCCKADNCNRNTVPHLSTLKLDPSDN